MQIHTVYFWLKPSLSEAEFSKFRMELEVLISFETIHEAYIGTPAPTEDRPVVDKSFHFSITVLFKSMEDHNAYQVASSHLAFIEKCSDMWEKVQVYDAD